VPSFLKGVLSTGLIVGLTVAVKAQGPSPLPTATGNEKTKPQRIDKAEASAGQAIYARYCAGCHGASLKGDGPVAAGLVKKPGDLTTIASRNNGVFPFDKVAATIDGRQSKDAHETKDMPIWGEVFALSPGADGAAAERAIARVAHYVWSKQSKVGGAAKE
jgi:mono/diheme cytochrome c family protein